MDRFKQFNDELNECKNEIQSEKCLKKWYEEIFDELVPKKVHLYLIELKIKYALQVDYYKSKKLPIPKNMIQNYKASQKFKVEEFTQSFQPLIRIYTK